MNAKFKKISAILLTYLLSVTPLWAAEGEMGYFGGISPGVKLPTITSLAQKKKATTISKFTLPYKENIYITGVPIAVEGTIEVRPGKVDKSKGQGKYVENYIIKAQSADGKNKVTRSMSFDTQYIYEEERKQLTKTSQMKKWTETIVIDGVTYSLDQSQSTFTKSILEDYTPGVMYYRGDIQYDAVYRNVTATSGNSYVTVSVNGPIYGYEQAFAKTETQRRNIMIDAGNDQYAIEETPTFTVHKDIQYDTNEPGAISFSGNHKEFIRSEGVLGFNILVGDSFLYEDEQVGTLNVETSPVIEQLSVQEAPHLKGHPAEADIKRMYSMKILDDDITKFSPNKVITKQEYIKMLVKALQLPIPDDKEITKITSPFKDLSASSAYYKYALAAYQAGLVDAGQFSGGTSMTREHMYVLNVKLIGLERLGIATLEAYTPFVDDGKISNGAKDSIYAASKIGLIQADNGYIFPKKYVTNVDACTFLNQLINYLRYDLQKDYNEKMMMY